MKMPSEHEEQVLLCQWLASKKIFYFAVPNGGNRNRIEAKKLKSEGVRAGIPDIVILLNGGKTVFIEMKRRQLGVLSVKQKDVIAQIECLGFDVIVAYGAIDAMEKINIIL
jgi:hypothetical protein